MHVVRKAVKVCQPNQRLTPENRLRAKHEFKRVFSGFRIGSKAFVFYAKPAATQKLGIIISKKNIKLAVGRNRVKRVVREWFRCHAIDFELIVIANRQSNHLSNHELTQCLDALLPRLIARCKKA